MKRWLFHLAATFSLLVSLTAAVAWPMSYAPSRDWHLLGIMHSADLRRVDTDRRTAVLMMPVDSSTTPQYGFWDACWALSRSGTLTLVGQTIDYEDGLRGVTATPPSVAVELSGAARGRAVVMARIPEPRTRVSRLGFAWAADAQQAIGGSVGVRVRMIALPYWSIVMAGLALPILWLRGNRRSRRRPTLPGSTSSSSVRR
jgi:hypothetical protein